MILKIKEKDKIENPSGLVTLKGLNLCFNIMNVKLCLLNQELRFGGLGSEDLNRMF